MSLAMGENVLIVELDALLETRLAVAYQLAPASWEEIVRHPLYRKRLTDDFSLMTDKFSKDAWYDAWDNRDASILEFTFMTNMLHLLHGMSHTYHKRLIDPADIYVTSFEMRVNCYPYNLSSDALKQIVLGVENIVGGKTKVTTMNLPTHMLTVDYLRENASGYVLYDLEHWEEQTAHRDIKIIPNLTSLWAPKKFSREGRPSQEVMDEAFPGDKKPTDDELFALAEHLHSPVIGLEFLDVDTYCLIQDPT